MGKQSPASSIGRGVDSWQTLLSRITGWTNIAADPVVNEEVKDLDSYVLVGDSYGAVSSIAVATRQLKGLKGLVLSGGFAKSPITSPLLKLLTRLAPFFPGPFCRHLSLWSHAAQLASSFDREGEIPWSIGKSRALFLRLRHTRPTSTAFDRSRRRTTRAS